MARKPSKKETDRLARWLHEAFLRGEPADARRRWPWEKLSPLAKGRYAGVAAALLADPPYPLAVGR